jgi:hypothetical protein
MNLDDYIDLDELHEPPDLIKIGEDDYIEIPQTKRQRLASPTA